MFADLDPLALRVCSALGTGVLQGLLLAVGVLVGLRAIPRSSAATRYAVAFVTLLVVAALPVIHFAISTNRSMGAIARVESGSLTPTLSRWEREPHIPHGDMQELHSSGPSRLAPFNPQLHRPAPAGNVLPLPPGEGRGEGRSLHSSLPGSWSQSVSIFWKTFLSMNRESGRGDVAAGVPPAVEGGVSPPGMHQPWLRPFHPPHPLGTTPGATALESSQIPTEDSLDDHASFPSLAEDLSIQPRTAWDFSSALSVLSQLWPTRVLPIRLALPATLASGITLAWLFLAVIRLGSLGWQCLALHRLKRQHQTVPAAIQEQFSELRREMEVHRAVRLGVVADLRSPIAIGFFHPTILLPEALVGSSPADLDPMLRHELAHIRRRDDWTNLIQQAVKAVFFFHPGVVALSRRLNLDREIACDDHVLAATRTPRDYALFLTDFASRTQGRQWAAAPAAWSNPNQLRERIHMILDPKRNTSPRMAPMRTGILTLAALLIAATGIGAAPRLALDATEAPDATTLASASVDTDVSTDVLIVTEVTEPETLLAGVDAVRVEVTTSDSDDDELDRPKEKPARTTGAGSMSSDDNKNANRNSRVIIRSAGGATSVLSGDQQDPLVLGAPTPAPHPEPAPHPDARPVPRPPKPARIAVESRTATMTSTEERSLEERMRRLEKLVDSLARKPQEMSWSAPKQNFHFEGLAKSMEQVSKDVERSMRDAERRVREAHERNAELAREKDEAFSAEGADKAQQAQRRAIEMQRQALRRQIESMESQVERLEDQLERLDDQLEAAVEAKAEAKERAKAAKEKQKEKSKPRHPDARPEQDPAAPTVQEPAPASPPTPPTPPTPEALIRN